MSFYILSSMYFTRSGKLVSTCSLISNSRYLGRPYRFCGDSPGMLRATCNLEHAHLPSPCSLYSELNTLGAIHPYTIFSKFSPGFVNFLTFSSPLSSGMYRLWDIGGTIGVGQYRDNFAKRQERESCERNTIRVILHDAFCLLIFTFRNSKQTHLIMILYKNSPPFRPHELVFSLLSPL